MASRGKIIRRTVVGGILLLLVAGVAAPYVQADRFGGRIRRALEEALHRKVEIGGVHFTLFNGPGFTVEDVQIDEDPAFGVEPFAFVTELNARVSLTGLLLGRLEFSSLELDDPMVNLVKAPNTQWNVIPLLQQGGGSSPNGARRKLPAIFVRSGRLNVKFGDTKSTFYFNNANVDIGPRSGEPGSFDIRFSGEPARTDRTVQGFGALNGTGHWIVSRGKESELYVDVELEKSPVDEVMRLLRGQIVGLHGLVATNATIKGPLSNLVVNGQLQLSDVHRWDLIPNSSGGVFRINYRGAIDWRNQKIDLAATRKDNPQLPLSARARVFDFLQEPHWATDITLDSVPAAPLVEVARHMGATLPKDFDLDGKLVGVIGYASTGGMQGQITLEDPKVKVGGVTRLEAAKVQLSLEGEHIRLDPSLVVGEGGQAADVAMDYQPAQNSLAVTVTAKALQISEMQTGSGHLLSAAAIPLFENLNSGRWTGTIHCQVTGNKPGAWTGSFDLLDVEASIPGVAQPIQLESASVTLDGDAVVVSKMRGRVGDVEMEGDYRYEPAAVRPHHFRVTIASVDLAHLEQIFLPTLRRERGFIARTLRLNPAPMPDWLDARHAEGTVRIETLTAGDLEWDHLRAHVLWESGTVQLTNLEAVAEESAVTGSATIDVSGPLPKYRLRGQWKGLEWKGAKVEITGRLDGSGTGGELLQSLQAEGSFTSKSLPAPSEGLFVFNVGLGGPKLTLTSSLGVPIIPPETQP
jgi:hypothetical protein